MQQVKEQMNSAMELDDREQRQECPDDYKQGLLFKVV